METNLNSSLFTELTITEQESLSGGDGKKYEEEKKKREYVYEKGVYEFKKPEYNYPKYEYKKKP